MAFLVEEGPGDARRATFNDDRRQPLRTADAAVGSDDRGLGVGAQSVPTGGRRPLLLAVDDEVIAVSDRRHSDPSFGQGAVEICRSAGAARRFAGGPGAEIRPGRIGGRRFQETLFLLFGAVPQDRHQSETVQRQVQANPGSTEVISSQAIT